MLDTSECKKPVHRMNFRGIRSSKFRHVYGAPSKRQKCFDNVKITRNAHDSNFCAVNPKFLAVVVEVGGGGSFLVVPLDKVGRVDHTASKVSGRERIDLLFYFKVRDIVFLHRSQEQMHFREHDSSNALALSMGIRNLFGWKDGS